MRHPGIEQRKPTRYKQPSRLNAVSLTLLLFSVAAVYFAIHTWPVVALRSRAKAEIQDVLPQLWRANLRDTSYAAREEARIKKELTERLRRAGVKDPKLELLVFRDKKLVAIEARFTAPVHYPWIDVHHVYQLAPRAQTDAARVEW